MRRVSNPPNPFHAATIDWEVDSDWACDDRPLAKLEVFEQNAKSALSKNTSPDVGFTWSVNPYQGCFHSCAYCYARPTHQYLGFGAGTDFDRKIVAKTNIATLLQAAFEKKSWQGETVVFSGNTDCYQPIEASYELTRACLEVCRDFRNPVSIITKSKLIRRDVDLLAELHRVAKCHVTVSIPFIDDEMARAIEPYASPPRVRLQTVRALANAGVPVGISIGPIIPGLSEDQIPSILEASKASGASWAFGMLLRLPREVAPVFDERLSEAFPLRAEKVRSAISEMRTGRSLGFGERMKGHGPRWDAIWRLFELHRTKHGLDAQVAGAAHEGPTTFERPSSQLSLFG